MSTNESTPAGDWIAWWRTQGRGHASQKVGRGSNEASARQAGRYHRSGAGKQPLSQFFMEYTSRGDE